MLPGDVRGIEKAQQHPGHAARCAPVGVLIVDVLVHPVFVMADEDVLRPQTAGAGFHHGRAAHIFHQDVAAVVVAERDGITQQVLQADLHVAAATLVAQGAVGAGMELFRPYGDRARQGCLLMLHLFQDSHSQGEFDDTEQREGRIHVDTGAEAVFREQGHAGQGFFVPHQGMDVPLQGQGVHGGLWYGRQPLRSLEWHVRGKQGQGEQKNRDDA